MPDVDWRRYLAPLAFLVAVTIAVALIRSGLESGGSGRGAGATTTTNGPVAKRYWRVRAGDTFALIARKEHVSIKTIERLNPKVSSTSLFVGERIRVQ
jgi:LysM repeat protein